MILRYISQQLLLGDDLLVDNEAPEVKLVHGASLGADEQHVPPGVDGQRGDGAGHAVKDGRLHLANIG